MKARLFLAEAATGHPDGTISMLRAGINVVWRDTAPVPFHGALVAIVHGDLGDNGEHHFDLRCLDQDGVELNKIDGRFGLAAGGGSMNLILQFTTSFPRYGPYLFVLRVDQVQLDTWTLKVNAAQASGERPAAG